MRGQNMLFLLSALPCRAVLLWLASGALSMGYAQVATNITPTGGAGDLGTTITQAGPSFDITGGTRPQNGPNLFHSFGEFSVGTGDTANFLNDSGLATANILSRVTGGNPSNIFGILQTTGFPGADLYLLNPAGVLFGPTASLNVEGSFHASTADFIELGDGTRFDATPTPNDAVLTTAPPAAFGFLDDTAAPINIIGSTLVVPPGETLATAGGNTTILSGTLSAPSGRVDIVSVASAGELAVNAVPEVNDFDRLGTIELNAFPGVAVGARIDASGEGGQGIFIRGGVLTLDGDSNIESVATGAGAGGSISIRADRVTQDHGSDVASLALSTGPGGDITVEAEELKLTNNSSILSATTGAGQAGDVKVDVATLSLADSSLLQSASFGSGKTGDVKISASESITTSAGSVLSNITGSTGDAGLLSVSAPRITLEDGRIEAGSEGSGKAADLSVNARSVVLRNGGAISSGTSASGDAGQIAVNATESVELTGRSSTGLPSGIAAPTTANTADAGAGGSLTIKTPRLTLRDALISTGSLGQGDAGDIRVEAGTVALMGGGSMGATTITAGKGGDITVIASESVSVSGSSLGPLRSASNLNSITSGQGNAGRIFVSTPRLDLDGGVISSTSVRFPTPGRQGNAGPIELQVGTLAVRNGGLLSSSTFGTGAGGRIQVNAAESVVLSDFGSGINVGSGRGADESPSDRGAAGDIFVTTPSLVLQNGAGLSAATLTDGDAGNITLDVGELRMTNTAFIANSSGGSAEAIRILPGSLATDVLVGGGQAGDVIVGASDRISLTNGSGILATTFGIGQGGNIDLTTAQLELDSGSSISAGSFGSDLNIDADSNAGRSGSIRITATDAIRLFEGSAVSVETIGANAGDIDLSAGFLLHLRDRSSITTSVAGGQGDGGNINIDPVFTVLDGGSRIVANAREGRGGNIRIVSDFLFVSPDSLIDASSELGVSGVVDIESPETDVVSGALALPESFLDAASLLSERCTARAIKGASSFIVSGRGGVPPGPETVLPSPLELGAAWEEDQSTGSVAGSDMSLALVSSAMGCGSD